MTDQRRADAVRVARTDLATKGHPPELFVNSEHDRKLGDSYTTETMQIEGNRETDRFDGITFEPKVSYLNSSYIPFPLGNCSTDDCTMIVRSIFHLPMQPLRP